MCFDLGNVCHPNHVWRSDFKLPVQHVVCDHGWLAAVSPRATFVADLRCDACQAGQPHTVLRTSLALIKKIVMQLAVTIDLAAVGPCLLDQICLTASSCARWLKGSLIHA